jgi:AcrR family transcriptional regulator
MSDPSPAPRRARSPAAKEERRAHLLATARAALADGADLRALSLNELARRAGMAKANVYRYFESREALLLALLEEEWVTASGALRAGLAAAPGPLSPRQLADALAAALEGAPLLCALVAALPSVLEQNLSDDAVAAFKRLSLERLLDAGAALHLACPALSAEGHARLLHDALAAVAGLHPFAHPAPAVARVMADPALALLRHDFGPDLRRFLRALAAAAADGAAVDGAAAGGT